MGEPSAAPKKGYKICANAECYDDNHERTQIGCRTKICPICNQEQPVRLPQLQFALVPGEAAKRQKLTFNSKKVKKPTGCKAVPAPQLSAGHHGSATDVPNMASSDPPSLNAVAGKCHRSEL
jgi:hypothetical protein